MRRVAITMVLGFVLMALPPCALGQGGDPVATRGATATPAVPKLVFALYYPWYGLKGVSGADRHFGKLDPIHKTISNFAHYPAAGPYDSTDPATVARQMSELKMAGVDVLACSWWGASDYTAGAIRALLPVAAGAGLKVCLYLEHLERPLAVGDAPSAIAELTAIATGLGQDPAYLRVDGKPVMFVSQAARAGIGEAAWARTMVEMASRTPPGIVVVGDLSLKLVNGAAVDTLGATVFDGLRYDSPARRMAQLLDERPLALASHGVRRSFHADMAREAAALPRVRHRFLVATVSPGYDGRKLASPDGRENVVRENGDFYRDSWDGALAQQPEWVLLQSYNQWEEGTEIEPSLEFGQTFLGLTRAYADRFHSGAAAPRLRDSPGAANAANAADGPRLRPVPHAAPRGVLKPDDPGAGHSRPAARP